MNHKVVCFSIVCQIIGCFIWLFFAPDSLQPFQSDTLYFSILITLFAIISSVYFYAWVLNKMMVVSKIEMAGLIFCIWLFYLMPNLLIVKTIMVVDFQTAFYVMVFSGGASFVNAIILPFSRSSRSIFKK
ncbi:hypothetical protein CBF23_000120 [Marinomonas agarivorans]|nr:hypothetical protein CBF23_000120 [Marinomonas agarivorans]